MTQTEAAPEWDYSANVRDARHQIDRKGLDGTWVEKLADALETVLAERDELRRRADILEELDDQRKRLIAVLESHDYEWGVIDESGVFDRAESWRQARDWIARHPYDEYRLARRLVGPWVEVTN